jgi:hypothetical protein
MFLWDVSVIKPSRFEFSKVVLETLIAWFLQPTEDSLKLFG